MCKKGPLRRIAQVKMPRLQTCTRSIFPSPSHFGSDFNIDTKGQNVSTQRAPQVAEGHQPGTGK